MKIIIHGVLAVVLTLAIIFETRGIFGMIEDRKTEEFQKFTEFASTTGRARVSIDELVTYPEVEGVDPKGEVIRFDNYDFNVKVNGVLSDEELAQFSSWDYTSATDKKPMTLTVDAKTNGYEDFVAGVNSYWHGSTTELKEAWNYPSEDIEYLQCSTKNGNIPVAHDKENNMYYMFVPFNNQQVLVLSSGNPFIVTDEKATVHFGDPNEDVYRNYAYNLYQSTAAEATVKELLEGGDGTESVSGPEYVNGTEVEGSGVIDPKRVYAKGGAGEGSAETYTSAQDNERRDNIAKLAAYEFKKDGTSDETNMTVDVSSKEAKKSIWKLTSDTYEYTTNGVTINNLQANRNSETFYLEGIVKNNIDAERPYVMLIKYIDKRGNLLGISVIDNRSQTIEASGASTFNVTVSPTRNHIAIGQIDAVMFEVY